MKDKFYSFLDSCYDILLVVANISQALVESPIFFLKAVVLLAVFFAFVSIAIAFIIS